MSGTSASGGLRHRKTRQQLERSGTFRADRHGDLISPDPPRERPTRPSDLKGEGAAEWDRMLERLELSQSMFKVDDAAIAQYCRLHAETHAVDARQRQAQRLLTRLEKKMRGLSAAEHVAAAGHLITLHSLIAKCTDQLRQGRMAIRQYLGEFGLTPASRGRVKLPAAPKAAIDEFTAFQRKRIG